MLIKNIQISLEVLGGEKIENVIKESLRLLKSYELEEDAIKNSYVVFKFNGVEMYVHQNDTVEDLLYHYDARLQGKSFLVERMQKEKSESEIEKEVK